VPPCSCKIIFVLALSVSQLSVVEFPPRLMRLWKELADRVSVVGFSVIGCRVSFPPRRTGVGCRWFLLLSWLVRIEENYLVCCYTRISDQTRSRKRRSGQRRRQTNPKADTLVRRGGTLTPVPLLQRRTVRAEQL